MERIKWILVVLFGVLLAGGLSSCSKDDDEPQYYPTEYDAEVGGLAYTIVSLDELTVEVVPKTSPSNYSGAISVPSKVTINGKSFTVIKINGAFDRSSVTSVTLPSTISVIGGSSFRECKNLKSFTIPSSVEEIEYAAFYKSGLEQITIPATVETIGLGAFQECENLKKVTIEDSREPLKVYLGRAYNVYDLPFCNSLIETLYCGRNVKGSKKDEWAQLGVNGAVYSGNEWSYTLKYLILGESVTELAPITYTNKAGLVCITCKGNIPPAGSTETPNDCFMKTIVYVPASAVETYKANEYWGKFWNIEPIK